MKNSRECRARAICTAVRTALGLGTVLVAGLGATAPVLAQSAPSASAGDDLTEIVVTARRTEENLQDVPISIQVFSQQELQNRNVVYASDLALYVPSLSVNTNFGNDNTAFALRGFTQDNGTAPSVGVFFADVISPRAASNGIPGGDGAGPGNFFDLENLQVLKGPQGTLFGRNTTGGDILLVPKKPTSQLEGYVQGGIGDYDDGEAEAVFNVPVNDSFRLRFGFQHENREGYEHNVAPNGPRDFDDVSFTVARLSAVVDITPNLENYTIASYSTTDDNGGISKIVAVDTLYNQAISVPAANQLATQPPGFYNVEQSLQHPASRLEDWQLINTSTWKATDSLTIKNIASYAQLRDYDSNAIFGSYFLTPTNGQPPFQSPAYSTASIPFLYATVAPLPGSLTAQERTITEELQAQGNALDNRLTYQGGAYFETELPQNYVGSASPVFANCANYNVAATCSNVFANLTPYNPATQGIVNSTVGRTKYQDYAFYFQDTYQIADPLKLTTGIRWTHDSETVEDAQAIYDLKNYPAVGIAPPLPPPYNIYTPYCNVPSNIVAVNTSTPVCGFTLQESSHAPTWLIDFDYTPVQDLLLYAKYSRGYREGVVNPTAPTASATIVQPEKLDTYEVGEKLAFHGPVTGTVNGAVFYNDFRNQQIQTGFNPNPNAPVPGSPEAAPTNAGKSRIWGVELDSSLKLFTGARLDVGYTYLDTRILDVTPLALSPTDPHIVAPSFHVGDELVLAPRNKLTVTPSYTLPLVDTIGTVTLSATWTYTGKQLDNYQDRNEPALAQYAYLDATRLLNLNVNWHNILGSPVDLTAFATNVTKVQYYTFCSGLGGVPGSNGFETCNLGAPFMFGARVKIRF